MDEFDLLDTLGSFSPDPVTVTRLRTVWQVVRRREKPTPFTLSAKTEAVRLLRTRGCSACDDDRHLWFLVRDGEVAGTASLLVHRDPSRELVESQAALRSLGVRAGDCIISLHQHHCAMDCEAEADAFLQAVRFVD